MKLANWVRLLWIFCLATSGATGGQARTQPHEEFTCTSGPTKRLVSIYRNASDGAAGCRVDYTKGGETKTLWSSKDDYPYCVKKAVELVTKLAKANYSCKPETIGQSEDSG
jgi:hypothetical protein